MTGTDKLFVYPNDVDNFGFDWGRLALTVGPKVNGAKNFSAGVVFVPPGQGHERHNHLSPHLPPHKRHVAMAWLSSD